MNGMKEEKYLKEAKLNTYEHPIGIPEVLRRYNKYQKKIFETQMFWVTDYDK